MHNLTRTLQDSPQLPLHIVRAGICELENDVHPHQHPTWEIVYVMGGTARCLNGRNTFEVRSGHAIVTPPYTVHCEQPGETIDCLYIVIGGPHQRPWPRIYQDDSAGTFGKLCSILIQEWNGQEMGRDAMIASLLFQLDVLLQRSYVGSRLSPTEQLVQYVEQRIADRFMETACIREITLEIGVSDSFLRTHFARLRGQTPMQYLQAIRVKHAMALISTSDLSLEAIAGLCGYDSASHLSRHVRRATGQSPGTFRTPKSAL